MDPKFFFLQIRYHRQKYFASQKLNLYFTFYYDRSEHLFVEDCVVDPDPLDPNPVNAKSANQDPGFK